MNRRQALGAMISALGLGAASQVFGAGAFLAGSAPAASFAGLDEAQRAQLAALGDTIIPDTEDSPGAVAAGVVEFVEDALAEYYTVDERRTLIAGLIDIDSAARARDGRGFAELDKHGRAAVLMQLETRPAAVYYEMLKQLIVWGYFASEAGSTRARRFIAIPGRYEPVVDIEPGTRAWAL